MRKIYIGLFLILSSLGAFAQKNDRIPRAERPIERLDLGVNRVSYLQAQMPELGGLGLVVSLKEFRFDGEDLDLLGKEIPSNSRTQFVSTHATNMATIIGGLGNSSYTGRGVAPEVFFSSTSFFNIAPEPMDYYLNNNISVQNHSYGIGIENFYGSEARAYDSLVYELPHLLHVFSAGNIGDSTSVEGPYAGIPGFANLTGTFKQAKNVLTVGAVDANRRIEIQSSKGPAYDGRIKPELVAFGEDGSSGAAAITSGVAILLQQAFAQNHEGQLPPAALIRSILINTADDLRQPGPDFTSGFGNLNARRALAQMNSGHYLIDSLASGDHLAWPIAIPVATHQLDVTLAWTDPLGDLQGGKALVNDLDLWVEDANGIQYYPWVLNPQAQMDSLKAPASRGMDSLNPQEKVSINQPVPGNYTLHLRNRGQSQTFALSYFCRKAGHFVFTEPTSIAPLLPDSIQPIRWDWTGSIQNGRLEYKHIDEVEEWKIIQDSLPLVNGQYSWQTPTQSGRFQLRMVLPDKVYLSDTFVISPKLSLEILSACSNNFLLNWSASKEIDQYTVFQLIDNRMSPIATTRDTFFLIDAAADRSAFSVASVIPSGKIGRRSLALDANLQQPPCYVRNFTAQRTGNQGRIDFNLSTNYNIVVLDLQKWDGTQFLTIKSWPANELDHSFYDPDIRLGNNYYRVRIGLINDEVLFTNTLNIFYVPEDAVLLYPNPANAGQELKISIPTFQGRSIYVYDARGRLLVREDILSSLYRLETQNWLAGFYFFTIVDAAGRREHQGKIIVK